MRKTNRGLKLSILLGVVSRQVERIVLHYTSFYQNVVELKCLEVPVLVTTFAICHILHLILFSLTYLKGVNSMIFNLSRNNNSSVQEGHKVVRSG